jgi:CubicO group peptidase (beta-lactamase class C family)
MSHARLVALALAAALPGVAGATTLRNTPGWAEATTLATVLSGFDQQDVAIDAWAVTPTGHWLVIAGGAVRNSAGFPADVVTAAKWNLLFGRTIEAADCASNGVCALVHSQGVYANGPVPALLTTRVNGWHAAGRTIEDLELLGANSYVLLGSGAAVSHVNVPTELARAIADRADSGRAIRDVSVGFDGRWWVQADSHAMYAGLDATTRMWADAGVQSAIDWDKVLLGPNNTFVLTDPDDTAYDFDEADPVEAVEAALAGGNLWSRMTEAGVPGLSIAILQDGQVVSARGYGTRTYGQQQPVYGSTPFDLASLSKMIGGITALGVLADRPNSGVTLTSDVRASNLPTINTWLGRGAASPREQGFALMGVVSPMPAFTLEQALSHTASIGLGGSTPVPASANVAAVPTEDWLSGWDCTDGTCDWSAAQTVWFDPNAAASGFGTPGGQYAYTSHGYLVVQAVLEDLMGLPAADLVDSYLVDPMGLSDTTAAWPYPASYGARVATQHNGTTPQERRYYPWTFAGGVTSSSRDYAEIVSVLLNSGEAPNGASILTPSAAGNVRSGRAIGGSVWAYGLGVDFDTSQGATNANGETFFHSGGHPGFASTYFCARPQDGAGIVILMNTDRADDREDDLRDEILDAFVASMGWVDEDCR